MKGDAEASPTRTAAAKRRSENPRPAAIALPRASLPPAAAAAAATLRAWNPGLGFSDLGRRRWRREVVDGGGGKKGVARLQTHVRASTFLAGACKLYGAAGGAAYSCN